MSNTDRFPRTPWEIFSIASRGDSEAKEAARVLCENYRLPVLQYIYATGVPADDAEDIAHGFFEDFLQRDPFSRFNRERGLFRVFLCQCIRNFLYKRHRDSIAQKRGGGAVHLSYESGIQDAECEAFNPNEEQATLVFDRYWALVVLNRVFDSLEAKYAALNKAELFEELRPLISESEGVSISSIAESLAMTENAVSVALHRLRKQFRQEVELEVESTVADSKMVEEEVAYLKRAVARILEERS